MKMADEHDYALERRLRKLDPALHRRFTDAVFALQHILSNYQLLFPQFTDHTELHSLNVIDFCNRLIGDQIDIMSADEVYTLLLGCYFHDTGMGISEKDYIAFSKEKLHLELSDKLSYIYINFDKYKNQLTKVSK